MRRVANVDRYRSPADQPDGVPDRPWATSTPAPAPQYPDSPLHEQTAATGQLVSGQASGGRGLLDGVVPLTALVAGMAYSYSQGWALGARFEGPRFGDVPGPTVELS